jgi:hypothetical protein
MKTDCREEENTVGIIHSIISLCRVLSYRNLGSREIAAALERLRQDEDVKTVMGVVDINYDFLDAAEN